MADDPYKYFRLEARELLDGLGRGVLEIERGQVEKEVISRLLRLAHTLKGAARVVRLEDVGRLAHAIEDVLAPFREGGQIPGTAVNELLGFIDRIAEALGVITPGERSGPARAPGRTTDSSEATRVDLDEMDVLLDGVAEATVQVHALGRTAERLESARRSAGRLVDALSERSLRSVSPRALAEEALRAIEAAANELTSGIELADRELAQVREAAGRLRMQPASSIFGALERAARDAAQVLGKKVDLRASGGDRRLDAHVLMALAAALSQVVRNAVAHGIEPEAERISAGKPPAGQVHLNVERSGDQVVFTCRDDGRGIDLQALRREATRAGDVPLDTTDEDLLRRLMRGGLTTAGSVTQVAGRAVGLDLVRDTVTRLRGSAHLSTERGRGTIVEIRVPLTMASFIGLRARAGGAAVVLPVELVGKVLQVRDSAIARSSEGESLLVDGQPVPFAPLSALLGIRATSTDRPFWSVILVQAGIDRAAIAVDALLGSGVVVMKPLPSDADVEPIVSGASIDAEGNPMLVLEAAALVAAARRAGSRPRDAERAPRLPVLIVDDSLTTRMLEQSILESAGYQTDLATSAEHALEKAKEQRYGLFIVDVEMPGMDGFEFVATTRADARLRDTPAILVTSRASPEDRRRGHEVGAREYIVKGEFDQGRLLQAIRDLAG